jgi:hypothetical protein
MQRRTIHFLLLVVLFLLPRVAHGDSQDPFLPIRQLSDEVYRLSQEMIHHGSEGHANEVVKYGKMMIDRTEKLIEKIESNESPHLQKKQKAKLLSSLKTTLKETREVVRLGEEGKITEAFEASRRASFQAKRSRQQIHAIR